jgi:two-component system nitrate/nitrite response regulator NarL
MAATITKLQTDPAMALIHPSRLTLYGLAKILEETPYKICLQATTFDAIAFQSLPPGDKLLALVGGQTPVKIAETVRCMRQQLGTVRILVIGISGEPYEVMLALQAGADGFLRESMTSQTLMLAVELIIRDEAVLPTDFVRFLSRGISSGGAEFEAYDDIYHLAMKASVETVFDEYGKISSDTHLSPRQHSILQGLVEGIPNKVIAQRLNITESTVKVHVKALLRKIRVKNRTQAAMWAIKHCDSD